MSYLKITLTQNNDYIAIRTDLRFSINFTNNSVFDGASVKVYKAFTKINGEIGFEDETNKVDGNGQHITYTQPQDATYQNGLKSNWLIFRVENAGASTDIEATVNIEYTILDTTELDKKNVRTNNLLIEQI
jgi:hypothetical protein